MAFLIGDRDDGVVERRLDMHDARMDDALLLLFEALLLTTFCGHFSHTMSSPSPSSCSLPCRGAAPYGCAHWYESAGRAPAGCGGAAILGKSPSRCDA